MTIVFALAHYVGSIWVAIDETIEFADGLLAARGMKFDCALTSTFAMFEFRDSNLRYLLNGKMNWNHK
jgi:hypothetical protein